MNPNVVILGGVHGNEVCGIRALKTIQSWPIVRGTLRVVLANPRASALGVRYTESNLNRQFYESGAVRDSYEYGRRQMLEPILCQADILLDLHASNTPGSPPFVICEENGLSLAKYLPASLQCSGFDTFQPGGTDYWMNKQGKVGLCLECGYAKDEASVDVAVEGVMRLLLALGMIEASSLKTLHPQKKLMMTKQYISAGVITFTKQWEDFSYVEAGEIIGFDEGVPIQFFVDGYILFPTETRRKGEEAFCFLEEKS